MIFTLQAQSDAISALQTQSACTTTKGAYPVPIACPEDLLTPAPVSSSDDSQTPAPVPCSEVHQIPNQAPHSEVRTMPVPGPSPVIDQTLGPGFEVGTSAQLIKGPGPHRRLAA